MHHTTLIVAALVLAAAPAWAQLPPPQTPDAAATGVPNSAGLPVGANPASSNTPSLPTGPASFASAQPLYPAAVGTAASITAPQPYAGGQIVARVGGEVVLGVEVLEGVEETLAANQDRIPPSEVETARMMLMKRNLDQLIDTKLLYAEARRSIPKENLPKIQEQVNKQFNQDRLPKLLEMTKTSTEAELDAKLQALGSSLALQRRAFGERLLAQQWLRQNIEFDEEVSHDEMLRYYEQHSADFAFEAEARWEELAVRFDRFRNKTEAYRALAAMGNEVWGGAKLSDVAKARSQGITANEGGQYDWTTRGSLVSQELNRALFTLPVGQLSQILETERGFHIVRVLERHDAGRKPFVEAQVEIREKIKDERTEAQIEQYMARLRRESRVWTAFDNLPQLSQKP